jgi:simple sugar transport system substrate-binding protein
MAVNKRWPPIHAVLSSPASRLLCGPLAEVAWHARPNHQGGQPIMHRTRLRLSASIATLALGVAAGTALAADPPGKGITMYMQMGGNPGDGATLARQTGAAAAAQALGLDSLNEQFSGWAPEKMIEQFKQALAAKPACIAIMGHPGSEAFMDLVKQAFDQGIEVTHGNAPLSEIQAAFGPKGFGYAGVDLYQGGKLTAERMIEVGQLKSGDQAMVYGVFSQAERGQSEKGLADTLEAAGLKVDRLEITQEVNSDASLAVPVLAAYVQSNPELKAIGTQHGGITGVLAEVLKKAGKKPGQITVGGIDLAPATIDGLQSGYVNVTLDQLLYLQGFLPVLQCVLTKAYKMPGISVNTGAGVVTPQTIGELVPLIEAGIR